MPSILLEIVKSKVDRSTPKPIDETIFSDGSVFFDSLIDDIHNAKHSIDIEVYMFNKDQLGDRITEALIGAAKRHVNIRILVDGAGTPSWGGNMTRRLERANIKTRIFHPFPWRLWHWSRSWVRVTGLLKAIYLMLKINSRNHRKVMLIDDTIAYVGSFNINKCHLKYEQGGQEWRDTGVKVTNTDLSDLKNAFEAAWEHMPVTERIREIFQHIHMNPTFRLNLTRHRRRILYKNLLRRMANAKKRIWITNAYFVPDNFLLRHLKDAAERGVDVRILLPHKSDIFVMPWASTAFYFSLLEQGVRIFEYEPRILHAKTLMIDDWVLVGSSNLNHRSLLHDLEVDVHLKLEQSRKDIEQQFLKDLDNSTEMLLDNWYHRPFYQRIIGRLALYMRYWI